MQELYPCHLLCHFKVLCTCNIQNVIITDTDNMHTAKYSRTCLVEHARVVVLVVFYGT